MWIKNEQSQEAENTIRAFKKKYTGFFFFFEVFAYGFWKLVRYLNTTCGNDYVEDFFPTAFWFWNNISVKAL